MRTRNSQLVNGWPRSTMIPVGLNSITIITIAIIIRTSTLFFKKEILLLLLRIQILLL